MILHNSAVKQVCLENGILIELPFWLVLHLKYLYFVVVVVVFGYFAIKSPFEKTVLFSFQVAHGGGGWLPYVCRCSETLSIFS